MTAILNHVSKFNAQLKNITSHLDGVASLALRLILGPVLIVSGWEKLTGANYFGSMLESFPFPFNILPPELSWQMSIWIELIGGFLLLAGLAVRWISLPLMVMMFVAGYSVHLKNGWAAIAPSFPSPVCVQGTTEYDTAGPFKTFVECLNTNERTIEGSKRLAKAKTILREHGNYRYLNGSGSIVKLNNGIEFAATYLVMLMALLIIGGGRYLSTDYWLARKFRID
ncbi:MAG: DoxX family protein [Proteobacteria bacterium]|nr:DoxX family protein [Pseudomonadota bacterium]